MLVSHEQREESKQMVRDRGFVEPIVMFRPRPSHSGRSIASITAKLRWASTCSWHHSVMQYTADYTAQDVRISGPYCSDNFFRWRPSQGGRSNLRTHLGRWRVSFNWSNIEMLELFYLWMISRFGVHQPTWQMKSSQSVICR